ncbi:MAG: site-specific integrase [Lactovum sp.]
MEIASSNPTKKIGNRLIENKEMNIWTKDEFSEVIRKIDKENYFEHHKFVTLWLLFMTGIRSGEAFALQWSDVDLESYQLTINKTLVYKTKKNYRFSSPKIKASIRSVILDKKTVEILNEWFEIQKNYTDTKFVLSHNGYPPNREEVRYAISKYAKAGNVHRIRIHDLRHSHASLLISLGENPLIIKERLGHCDVKTTLGTYGHLYPDAHNSVADKLTNLVTV